MSWLQHTFKLVLVNGIILKNPKEGKKGEKTRKKNRQDKNKAYNKTVELNSNISVITLNVNRLDISVKKYTIKIKSNYTLFMSNTFKNIR